VSNQKPFTYADFYSCIDRQARERIFAVLNNLDGAAGSFFIVVDDDYYKVI